MKKPVKPTRLEMELLEALWKLGSASIREIQQSLPEDRRPEYTTVQTIIYRLEQKHAVERVKKIGNAHIFRPLVSRKTTFGTLVDDFMETFGGSPEALMSHLFESGRLSLRDLKELERQSKARRPDTPP
jgi:BlaI family transcriptional regulator, penicillinase repressor